MNDISDLGGTPDVFARATGDQTYSLVGAAGDVDYGHVAETSSDEHTTGMPMPTGNIHGELDRNHDYMFEPLLSSPAEIDPDLYTALYRPATAWPNSSDPGYAAASAYIAHQLLPNENWVNVRDAYSDLTATSSWAGLDSRLDQLRSQEAQNPNPGFPKPTFDDLLDDYEGTTGTNPTVGEFQMVDDVNKFFETTIREPYTGAGLQDYIDLQTLAARIDAGVSPNDDSTVDAGDIIAVIQGVVDTVGAFIPEEGEVVASLLSGVLGTAAGGASYLQNGAPLEQQDPVQATAPNLADTLQSQEKELLLSLDTLDEIAVSDPGRLAAMDGVIANVDLTPGTLNALGDAVELAHKQELATALVGASWTLPAGDDTHGLGPTWMTAPDSTIDEQPNVPNHSPAAPLTDVRDWECSNTFDTIHPYNQMAPSTEYSSITDFSAIGTPLHTVFFIVPADGPGQNGSDSDRAMQCERHWPPHDLASGPVFSALFASPGDTVSGTSITGLGLYPPTWWWRNFKGAKCWNQGAGLEYYCDGYRQFYSPAPAWDPAGGG